ncbi:hypothetical protein [Yoonia maritima]|uniref:hypothetical protein n=1 Tax=Yoonia maritima TaxID=1435347 RepID=UPI000D0FA3A9|nr:hypothetical protein [Yoonia maritima]
MVKKNKLTDREIGIIKAMLKFFPKLSQQAIHSYFSKPGRDFNQARITNIAKGELGKIVPTATKQEAEAYMSTYTGTGDLP